MKTMKSFRIDERLLAAIQERVAGGHFASTTHALEVGLEYVLAATPEPAATPCPQCGCTPAQPCKGPNGLTCCKFYGDATCSFCALTDAALSRRNPAAGNRKDTR